MNDQIQALRRLLRTVWPYRWYALAMSTFICVTGWFLALYTPNVYQVSAKIFVDTRSMLRPLLRGLAVEGESLAGSASLMKRTLLTRPNLEEVARKTDLDLKSKNERDFDLAVTKLAEKIKLEGTPQDNIYEIAYTDSDRQLAKRVVDELLNTFLESALGSSRKDTASSQKFIDEQIAEYEKRLIEAEHRLKEFKQRNVGHMPEEGGSYYRTLQDAKAQLTRSQLELAEAQQRSSTLRQKLEGNEPVLGMMGGGGHSSLQGPIASQYDGRIQKLQEQIDQMLLQFTEKHPDIVALRQQLDELKSRRDAELKERAEEQAAEAANEPADVPVGPAEGISVFQEVKLALAEADADVAALSQRVSAYKEQVQRLEQAVDTIPEIEAELKRLNRDYGLNKQQYDELLKRRESARLSHEADQQSDDVKLKVIEPPRVPLLPIGPKRIQMMSMVLLGGLGAGAGFAFLLSQINPRFYSSEELKEIAQLPILGTVSLVYGQRQRTERRMELAVFSLVLFGLLMVYGGLVALEAMNVNLNAHITGLIGGPSA